MLARPLLRSASYPSPLSAFEITAQPHGAWPWGNAHRWGVADGLSEDYTYTCHTNPSGDVAVAVTQNATKTTTVSTITAGGTVDQHNSPAIELRADGRLLAIYMGHSSPNAVRKVTVNPITSDPTISGGWGSALDISAQLTGTAYTYPDFHWQDDGLYLFYRDFDGVNNWEYSVTTDGGDTWATKTTLTYGTRYYARMTRASGTRLDFTVCDGSYAGDHASLYHFYRDGSGYHKSDGTLISGTSLFNVSQFTKIYDGATAGVRAPADIRNDGASVQIVFAVQTGTPGPIIGEDEDYIQARAAVGSGSWATHIVASAVGGLTVDYTEGSLAIDWNDINHLIVSKRLVSDISSPWRLYDYRTVDAGASWSPVIRPTLTSDPVMYPTTVRNHTPAVQDVALSGTFTDQSTFDNGIQGWGTA